MSQDEWADLVRGAFGAMNNGPFSGAGGGTTVREEIYTRSDGARIVRRTTTTRSPGGGVSQSISERIVGVGGPFDQRDEAAILQTLAQNHTEAMLSAANDIEEAWAPDEDYRREDNW